MPLSNAMRAASSRARGRTALRAEHAGLRLRGLEIVLRLRVVRARLAQRRRERRAGRRDLRFLRAQIGLIDGELVLRRLQIFRGDHAAREQRALARDRGFVGLHLELRLAQRLLRGDLIALRRGAAGLQRAQLRGRERELRLRAAHRRGRHAAAAVRARGRRGVVARLGRRPRRATARSSSASVVPAVTRWPTRTSTARKIPGCANATFALLPAGGPMRPCATTRCAKSPTRTVAMPTLGAGDAAAVVGAPRCASTQPSPASTAITTTIVMTALRRFAVICTTVRFTASFTVRLPTPRWRAP